MVDLTFAEEQGSYLVGVAAALKTKAKHVGFVGGTHGPLIKKFEAGFQAGVKSVDPTSRSRSSTSPRTPVDTTGFENPTGGKTAAEGMIDDGADIIYHAAGKSGLGVFDAVAAAGEGNWAIGVDSDQYNTVAPEQQPHILTSMLKRIDTAVYDYIKAFDDGQPAVRRRRPTTWPVDGVGYSTSGGFIDDITG